MLAAIYVRRSNPQPGVAAEAKSVARQLENARAFAVSHGWIVEERNVFADDGVRGSEFERRPGYVALMNALKPRPSFQVLIVSEQKSIGRESFETNFAIKQLALAGVNVVEYVHGRSLIPKTWLDKAMVAVEAAADEAHREKTSERMWETHKRLATKGYVTGARVFGYRNQDVFNGTDEHGRPLRSHVVRVIEPTEADVVRRIFTLCAAGHGVKGIAKMLNAEGVRAPRPRPGRPQAWAPSSVRCVLYRELYRGVNVWNKRRQSDSWGRRVMSKRPASEWIPADVPQLRIISDEEWAGAHRRLDTARQIYLKSAANGQKGGRPPASTDAKYLLSGLMQCARCGASMVVRMSSHGRGRRWFYVCAAYNDRGRTVCENSVRLPMTAADDAILSKLSCYVLEPTVVEGAIADALAELRPSRGALETRRATIQAEMRRLQEEQAKFVTAISVAGDVEVLAHALREREQQRTRLGGELAALDTVDGLSAMDVKRLERDLRDRLGEYRSLLGRQPHLSRQIISRLLDGRINWTPSTDRRRYEYTGRVRFDGLLSGDVGLQEVSYPRTGTNLVVKTVPARAASSFSAPTKSYRLSSRTGVQAMRPSRRLATACRASDTCLPNNSRQCFNRSRSSHTGAPR